MELIQKGFSAAVYTQTTDVEGEINGLMTYDRKVIKMNEAKVREINQQYQDRDEIINRVIRHVSEKCRTWKD